MLSATKKSYYSNLDIKKVTDNRTFWRSIISRLTKRHLKGEKINLLENGKNISNDTELCNIFNGFFSNIISDLNIPKKYHCFPNNSIWIQIQFSPLSRLLKVTQAFRIPKVQSLIWHFPLRTFTLMPTT